MKIAITFWGTQKYIEFLPEWYERLEKYFVPGVEKQYFVFTDGDLEGCPDNITKMEIPHYGFPTTYHKTFEEMLRLEKEVVDYDWLVSVDADLYIQQTVEYKDFFAEDKKYLAVHHPCHAVGFQPHNKEPGSYDVNPLSNACITEDIMDMSVYYQGCLWGGKVSHIFDMMKQIDEWTKDDLKKNVSARFFEESYMNKWFLTHKDDTNTLPPSYAYPEMFAKYCEFDNIMMHLAKDNKALDNNQW
jgi:hypothetical protein